MNVDLIFQIAGVGIIVAGLVAVLFILSQQIGDLFDTVKNIFSL